MTKINFSARTSGEQRRILLEEGAYLGHRKDSPWSVLLYQLRDFYVEVFFSMENLDIRHIEAFDDTDRLDPYLESISLEVLTEGW
ncbi:MAG: hypothetical protein EOO12_05220 [Chitinophagaceae bacterium]|nr:MAG: hypothetical protein EOO12_05220 [Chitinophagaceae bacterium]